VSVLVRLLRYLLLDAEEKKPGKTLLRAFETAVETCSAASCTDDRRSGSFNVEAGGGEGEVDLTPRVSFCDGGRRRRDDRERRGGEGDREGTGEGAIEVGATEVGVGDIGRGLRRLERERVD